MEQEFSKKLDTGRLISDLIDTRLKPYYARRTKDTSQKLGISEQMVRIVRRDGVARTQELAKWAYIFDCEIWWMLKPNTEKDEGVKYPINHAVWTVKRMSDLSEMSRTVHWGQAINIAVHNPTFGMLPEVFARKMGMTLASSKTLFYRRDILLHTLYRVADLMPMPLWWYAYAGQRRFEDPMARISLFEQPPVLVESSKFDADGHFITPGNVVKYYYTGKNGVDIRNKHK